MQRTVFRSGRIPAAMAVAATTAVVIAPSAYADPIDQTFVNALSQAGVGAADPAQAVELGQSVCPMLAEPGQNAADVAAKVADASGMSLGPATMFTGIAISTFCPAMVAKAGEGNLTGGSADLAWSILGLS
ncbi:DUF732 domain-containing protein [Mycolicibacterium fortuitum]|uniref:DUF732 domain-containing protein n=1 Tax=Mycolicibacterium TaxID=1866885 RepID=UPI0007ED12BA|nr:MULTISPECIES: DUF732 domain-containing protein [Mycolicibacterium]OBI57151.1 hypothetical protein A5667_20765 [Mycolicibacterium fortuitum]OBK09430.1 hypothetical protein A5637_29705 [Mycolicibacterium fortuitum]OMC04080.1 hypothetical protein A5734_11030 [Mycolicibacterium fortuitum]UBV12985.1 DUF732 domain-containing protein [Mycolicibacterium fortuitum]